MTFAGHFRRRTYSLLVVDDEWRSRERDYRKTLGDACQLEFIRSETRLPNFRNREYDAYIIDVVLDSNDWVCRASDVIEELRPSEGEFSGPVFLVTNQWSKRDSVVSREFSGALGTGSPVSRILPWSRFCPDSATEDARTEALESTREDILLDIDRWQGMAGFALGERDELRILHLFNLQFGVPDHRHLAPMEPAVLARALRKIESGPHLIVVSGNLTYSGLPSEFTRAHEWLVALSSELWSNDSPDAHVFIAPGSRDVNRVLAMAGEYSYIAERKELTRLARALDDERRRELGAFALAPFQRFSVPFMSARQWSTLRATPTAIVESRFRRFGIRLFGVSPGFDVAADDRVALEIATLSSIVDRAPVDRDAVRIIIGEHGASLASSIAQASPEATGRRSPLLVFLSAEGDSGSLVQAVGRSAIVVPGPISSEDRRVNLVKVSPFEKLTIHAYACRGGALVAVREPVMVGLPDPEEYAPGEELAGPRDGHGRANPATAPGRSETVDTGDAATRRVLMVTVTSNERKAVFAALKAMNVMVEEKFTAEFDGHEFRWPREQPKLLICIVRTEDQRAPVVAARVTELHTLYNYEAILMVGMAMGLPERTRFGDVLVPGEVVSVAHQRETAKGLKSIPHYYRPNAIAIRRMHTAIDSMTLNSREPFKFRVHTRQLACGDLKLEDPAGPTLALIADASTDIYGYEMEAEGFFTALRDQRVEGLLIKGIADFADVAGATAAGTDEKEDRQLQAATNALHVALAFLDHLAQRPL